MKDKKKVIALICSGVAVVVAGGLGVGVLLSNSGSNTPTEPSDVLASVTTAVSETTEPSEVTTESTSEMTEVTTEATEETTEATQATTETTEATTEATQPTTKPSGGNNGSGSSNGSGTTKPTEPKPTEPTTKPTEPKETQPKPTEPTTKPTEPKETQPKPTEPKETKPATDPTTKPTDPPTEPTTEATEPPMETIDTAALEAYGRSYASSTYGYNGTTACNPSNGCGYGPAATQVIETMDEGYSIVRQCIDGQYANDIGSGNPITMEYEGQTLRRRINLDFVATGKPNEYLIYVYYG